MMFNFKEDIIKYLKEYFEDDDFFPELKIKSGNLYANKLNQEQITIIGFDENEDDRYTTFDNAEINNIAIQINCYAQQKTLNNQKRSASDVCEFLAQLVTNAFDKNYLVLANKNIKRARKVSQTPAMPVKEGSEYYVVVLRYEMLVNYDYEKGE